MHLAACVSHPRLELLEFESSFLFGSSSSVTLAELEPGSSSTIAEVSGPRAFRRRLLELGLIPGTPVLLLRRAPLGDPLELEARGSLLSIRKREAEHVRLQGDVARAPSLARGRRATANPR